MMLLWFSIKSRPVSASSHNIMFLVSNDEQGPEHLPNYHRWMQDPKLLDATASEPLSMEEEVRMQGTWRDDETKCTFIILSRDLVRSANNAAEDIPPPPNCRTDRTKTNDGVDDDNANEQKLTYPLLVEQTLHAMVGDINLFLSEEEEEPEEDTSKINDQQQQPQPEKEILSQAELDIMIASPSHRNKKLGTEAVLMMMYYGAQLVC